jgi:hypothetical protein
LSFFLVSCGGSSSRPSSLLYVLAQGTNGVGNFVSTFAIDLTSGALSLVNSNATTCSTTGATSCGPPLDIVLDPTGATAVVLNQGVPSPDPSANIPPTVYPYTVNSDGSLSNPLAPVYWTCVVPAGTACSPSNAYPDTPQKMVRDATGQFLFIIDQGVYPSPTTCPAIAAPAMTSTDAANFAGCPSITVFATTPGTATPTLVSQSSTYQSPLFLSKIPTGVSAIPFTPPGGSAQELLFVTNNVDICTVGCNPVHNDNTVSVYMVGSTGLLTEQAFSPYTISTVNPISVLAVNTNPPTTNSGGIFVYVGSQPSTSGAISIFTICTVVGNNACTAEDVANSQMVPVDVQSSASSTPVDMIVDPTNNFLYVLFQGSNVLYGFTINTTSGKLTAQTPASVPTGSQPVAMAMRSSVQENPGQFLYVSNTNSSNITGYSLSTTSGSMTNETTTVSPAGPTGMAAR